MHGTVRGNPYRGSAEYRQSKVNYRYQGKVVSYMFFNFPTNTNVEKLWSLFRRFGKVLDIYMARKKLRNGKEFGFVRFSQVEAPRRLEAELNGAWIGMFKLRVFPAWRKEDKMESNGRSGSQWNEPNKHQVKRETIRDDRTYREVVQGMKIWRSLSDGLKVKPKMEEGLEWLEVEVDRCPKLEEKLSMSLLGSVKKWRFLGGLDILLECSSRAEAEGIVKKLDHGLREWVKELRFWSEDYVIQSRLTWIKLFGLPVDAWNGRNFHKIASTRGSVIKLENCEFESATSLVAGRVLISTCYEFSLEKEVLVKTDNRKVLLMVKDEEWIDEVGVEEDDVEEESNLSTSEDEEDWSDDFSVNNSIGSQSEGEAWLGGDQPEDMEGEFQQLGRSGIGHTTR
ncbi:hypothetical protein L1887_17605 [Cichorium endivia]|nr:hypothetical protein L1887_17605 [Cichorium endivia]